MRQLSACLALAATLWLAPAHALDTGDPIPALKTTTLDGRAFDISALKGKVVVLNLWATWCTPCRTEMPALDKFYAKYRDRGVVVFGLDENDPDDVEEVKKVMADFSYPAALGQAAAVNDIRMPRVLPITYVIDAKGIIRTKLWPGGTPVTEENLEQAVDPLLAASP